MHSVRRLLTANLLTTFPSLAEIKCWQRESLKEVAVSTWRPEGNVTSGCTVVILHCGHSYTLHQAQEQDLAWPTLVITLVSALARATVANHHPGAGPSHPLSYGWKKEVSSVHAWATPPAVHPLLTRPSLTVQEKLLRMTKKCSDKHSDRQTY